MQTIPSEAQYALAAARIRAAYKSLPAELRPFYAHIHCGSAAIIAVLGQAADSSVYLKAAVDAVEDLAADADSFDREAAEENGSLAALIPSLAEACPGDTNSLILSLDAMWACIAESPIASGADNDEEDPVEHYLYDNTDLTGLVYAYRDLNAVLDNWYENLHNGLDFEGSLIELSDNAVPTPVLVKSLRRLSSSSRACVAWGHNTIVSLLRAITNDDLNTLEEKLEASGIQPLFIPAVLEQVKASEIAYEVLKADARRYSPFDRSFDYLNEQMWNLHSTVSQMPEHPVRRTFALLLAALAAMFNCRPEDVDARTSSNIEGLDDLESSNLGLALNLAATVADIELVESDDDKQELAKSLGNACGSAETRCAVILPLSFAISAAFVFAADTEAMDKLLETSELDERDAETFRQSLEALRDILVFHEPTDSDQPIIQRVIAGMATEDYDMEKAAERYASLLIETLEKMDEDDRDLLIHHLVASAFVLSGLFKNEPEEVEAILEDAFEEMPTVAPIIIMCLTVLRAIQEVAMKFQPNMEGESA